MNFPGYELVKLRIFAEMISKNPSFSGINRYFDFRMENFR